MSDDVKLCPLCGHPMRREGDRRVCDYCGYTEPAFELVAHNAPNQEDEYIQTSKRRIPRTYISSAPANHKSIRKGINHATQILHNLGLHDEEIASLINEATNILKIAMSRGLVKGRAINMLMEGILYALIKRRGLPINLDRLAQAIAEIRKSKDIEQNKDLRQVKKQVKSEILKSYNLLRDHIGGEYFTPHAEAPAYIDKYCEELSVSDEVRRLAREIFNVAKERRLTVGRNPSGIAAAAIYVAAKILRRRDIQQRKVARQAGITEVTLRNRSRELERVICKEADELEERFSEALGFDIDLHSYCENVLKRKKK